MAKGAYIGVSDKARKIKKGYIGVDGKARKIKKGYIGVGGKARPFWSGGKLAYFGEISPLKEARLYPDGEYVGNYFLIAGGQTAYNASSWQIKASVDAYSKDFVKQEVSDLSERRTGIATAGIGSFIAIFLGGTESIGSEESYGSAKIDIFDENLVHQTMESSKGKMRFQNGGRAGGKAIFAAGYAGTNGTAYSSAVLMFDKDMVITNLSSWKSGNEYGDASTPHYFIIPQTGNYSDDGAAWDEDGVRHTITPFTSKKQCIDTASTDELAFFAGGFWNSYTSSVFAYTDDLVLKKLTSLPNSMYEGGSVSVSSFAVFASGYQYNGQIDPSLLSDSVTGYSSEGVQQILDPIAYKTMGMAGAGYDGYGVIAGGYRDIPGGVSYDMTISDKVYAYVVE